MNETADSTFDLAALQERRDKAVAKCERWESTAQEVMAAYKAGERYLRGANLRGADLRGADLGSADLSGAYLGSAYLGSANLRGAYLGSADLDSAIGIRVDYGAGKNHRLVYAYIYSGELRIQAGCRNGTAKEIRAAVKEDYAKNSDGYADYMDLILMFMKWGKRELKRQTELDKEREGHGNTSIDTDTVPGTAADAD